MPTEKPERPNKVVLGTYRSHEAAQHVVDILAEHKFPVERVSIVGTGLRLKEIVVGRWTLGRALVTGALTGGWIGLLIGLVFLIVSPWAAAPVLSAIVIGIVLGLIWALVAHVWQRRSFASVPEVVADRYDVLVDAPFAEEARRVLGAALATSADRSNL
jgi:tetrahydromethanopterin S-methyltransferase subunit F